MFLHAPLVSDRLSFLISTNISQNSYSKEELTSLKKSAVLPSSEGSSHLDELSLLRTRENKQSCAPTKKRKRVHKHRGSGINSQKHARRLRKRQLHILQWNIEGSDSIVESNIDFHENDIIALCETLHSKPVSIEGFNVIEVPAQQERGRPVGGLILATRSAIQAQVVSVSQVHIHAMLPNTKTHVVSTHFAPDTDVDEISHSIADILRNIPTGEVTILLGNFNCLRDANSRVKDLEKALGQWNLLLHSDPELPTKEQLASSGTISSTLDLMFSDTNKFLRSTTEEDTSSLHKKHKKVKSIFKIKSNFCGLETTTTERE